MAEWLENSGQFVPQCSKLSQRHELTPTRSAWTRLSLPFSLAIQSGLVGGPLGSLMLCN